MSVACGKEVLVIRAAVELAPDLDDLRPVLVSTATA
jgi:hypothetical protein